ncbi:MAG: hypothetical protein KF764_08680 [Labilithrix sp.]|nr:hypothetical protein [Labilithrix sp.]
MTSSCRAPSSPPKPRTYRRPERFPGETLTRGPRGVEPLVVFQGAKMFHLPCLPDPASSRARECTYKIRLSQEERDDWDALLASRGDADLAAMLRALVVAELGRARAR